MQKIALIGAGRIGKELLRMARIFDLRLVAFDPRANDVELGYLGARKLPLEALLREADFVVACCLLDETTRHLFGESQFAQMRPDAVLLNVGRGPLVDEPALAAALEGGRLRGAALDVFEQEPLPSGHPLYTRSNLLLSPHSADQVQGWREQAHAVFEENLRRYLAGEPLLNVVDKARGY